MLNAAAAFAPHDRFGRAREEARRRRQAARLKLRHPWTKEEIREGVQVAAIDIAIISGPRPRCANRLVRHLLARWLACGVSVRLTSDEALAACGTKVRRTLERAVARLLAEGWLHPEGEGYRFALLPSEIDRWVEQRDDPEPPPNPCAAVTTDMLRAVTFGVQIGMPTS